MPTFRIEQERTDKASLARSLSIKVNGCTVSTPSRALGATRSTTGDLEVLGYPEFQKTTAFTEVYSALSVEKVGDLLEDQSKRGAFESEVDRSLRRAQAAGQAPYLMLNVTDRAGQPLDSLPADDELDYILDLAWRPTNTVALLPLFGKLRDPDDLDLFIKRVKSQVTEGGEKPLVAPIPSVYRSMTRIALEKYWKAGMRAFALDLGGRGLGAQGTVVTLVNRVLRKLSKESREPYFLLGLNVRPYAGTGELARVHNLLGHAYGFDVIGLNHGRTPGWAGTEASRREQFNSIRFCQTVDYSYPNVYQLAKEQKSEPGAELDTPPFDGLSLDSLRRYDVEQARRVSKLHNATKDLREDKVYKQRLESGNFIDYLTRKARISGDLPSVRKVASDTRLNTEL